MNHTQEVEDVIILQTLPEDGGSYADAPGDPVELCLATCGITCAVTCSVTIVP